MCGNIFLVGLMGAGKTTVGRALAKRLNKRFLDSDHEIEARTGASIPLIFEIEGEDSFRQREAEVIRRAGERAREHGLVIEGVRQIFWQIIALSRRAQETAS